MGSLLNLFDRLISDVNKDSERLNREYDSLSDREFSIMAKYDCLPKPDPLPYARFFLGILEENFKN